MPKVAMIGAGSVVFARTLIADMVSWPELRGATIALMDIDAERLGLIERLAKKMVAETKAPARVEATLDRRRALDGADYVMVMIQVGGLEAFELDINIPLKYGVNQEVGDTLGPGGVFRALRTIPVLLDIARDIGSLCPGALLINYSNPMAMNCWALNAATRVRNVGLCHSVQGTAALLAEYLGVPFEEVSYWCAGINHQAFYLDYRWQGRDAYPMLWDAMKKPEVWARDKVRWEMMKHLGYFITESSHHLSEYVPYFRKRESLRKEFCEPRWFYLEICRTGWQPHYEEVRRQIAGEAPINTKRSAEYASYIIRSLGTGEPFRFNGSVRNDGLITNLPHGCCVEVPCYVDKTGIHPAHVGDLPPQCVALNRTNVNVQELAVKAGIEGDRDAARQAVMFDPLTAAVLSLGEIRQMVDELFEAEKGWLPQFR